jgi:hypothetical protein
MVSRHAWGWYNVLRQEEVLCPLHDLIVDTDKDCNPCEYEADTSCGYMKEAEDELF